MEKIYKMYINGEWVNASSGKKLGIINPATEEIITEVPYGGREEAVKALEAAQTAFKGWATMTAYERGSYIKKIADLIRSRADDMARTLTMEEGKTLFESKGEVMSSAAYFEWFAEEGKRLYGEVIPQMVSTKRHWTIKHPVGVAVTISPWNFPIVLQARKIAPALAAGCTVVARPASQTPMIAMDLFGCIHDAGLPKGVANLVTGQAEEVVGEFMRNSICRKLSFTGSTEVGKQLIRDSADQIKKLSLELGGHAPVVVFPDVDIEQAAKATVIGKFRNMGQVCISPTRIFVHDSIYEKFTERAVEVTKNLRIGNGLEEGVDVGPLFEPRNIEKTYDFIKDAVSKGAKVLCGGKRPEGEKYKKGYFFEPTVLVDVSKTMRLTCEETFGPILPIYKFSTIEEAIQLANDTTYGLASYVLTNDMRVAIRMAEGLECGIIGINDMVPATAQSPFGGMKESGIGREGAHEGIESYLETKAVSFAFL